MKKFKLTSLAVLSAMALSACSTVAERKTTDSYNQTNDEVSNILNKNKLTNGSSYNIDKNGIYVDKTPIDTLSLDSKKSLPKKFNSHVTINDQDPKTMAGLGAFLTKVTGQKVSIQQDLLDDTLGSTGSIIGGSSSAGSTAASTQSGGSTSTASFQQGTVVQEVIYSGTVKGLFDHIASKLNVYWKYEGGVVEFYKYETKMFSLDALAGTSKLSSKFNTSSSSSSSSSSSESSSSSTGAQSGQEVQLDNTTSIWEEVGTSIQSVLSENEKLSLTPSAGKIVVMASPSHMRKVENILKNYNQFYARQVRLDVKVYEVQQTDEDNYGINWTAAWASVSDKVKVAANAGSSLSTSGISSFTLASTSGNWSGSSAVFQALSTAGKVSLLRNNQVVTLNNQSVPLNVARERAYVQSTSVTTTSGSNNNSVEYEPGIVTEGFAMNMTPLVNDKGEILLQYSLDISSVDEITTMGNCTSGTASCIQLPQRTVSNFMQKVNMNNGESLVLTAFQQLSSNNTKSGVGSASLWGLGGSKSNDHEMKTIVVVITPYIMK